MAPESHFSNPFFPTDKSLAVQIVEASRYEHAHVAGSKPSKKMDPDTASVSSFGSSIGLLKSKFRSSSSPSSSSSREKTTLTSQQKKGVLRNQVNIVG